MRTLILPHSRARVTDRGRSQSLPQHRQLEPGVRLRCLARRLMRQRRSVRQSRKHRGPGLRFKLKVEGLRLKVEGCEGRAASCPCS